MEREISNLNPKFPSLKFQSSGRDQRFLKILSPRRREPSAQRNTARDTTRPFRTQFHIRVNKSADIVCQIYVESRWTIERIGVFNGRQYPIYFTSEPKPRRVRALRKTQKVITQRERERERKNRRATEFMDTHSGPKAKLKKGGKMWPERDMAAIPVTDLPSQCIEVAPVAPDAVGPIVWPLIPLLNLLWKRPPIPLAPPRHLSSILYIVVGGYSRLPDLYTATGSSRSGGRIAERERERTNEPVRERERGRERVGNEEKTRGDRAWVVQGERLHCLIETSETLFVVGNHKNTILCVNTGPVCLLGTRRTRLDP